MRRKHIVITNSPLYRKHISISFNVKIYFNFMICRTTRGQAKGSRGYMIRVDYSILILDGK